MARKAPEEPSVVPASIRVDETTRFSGTMVPCVPGAVPAKY